MKKNATKRIMAALLCLCMAVSLAPAVLADPVMPSLSISATTTTVKVGATISLNALASDGNPTAKTINWLSDDTSVATVDGNGTVTGVSAGDATITVSADGYTSAEVSVTVEAVPVTGITLDPSTLALAAGDGKQLAATISPNNATNKEIDWTSDNPSVAAVSSSGYVTGLSAGTTVIKATTVDGSFSKSCTVTVTGTSVTPTISDKTASIAVNGTKTVTISNVPANGTVTWTTANSAYVTVSGTTSGTTSTGTIKGVKATTSAIAVTATVKDSTGATVVTLTCNVTVTSSSTASNITYSTSSNSPVTFKTSNFNSVCSSLYGNNLDYVTFTLPSTSYGVLYYDYDEDDKTYDHKVTASRLYYYNGSSSKSYLSKVTFVPKSGYSGTVSISYTGYDSAGNKFTGTIRITVGSSGGDISYSVSKNEVCTFDVSDFNTYCKDETGSNLSYVKFTLPSSSKGVLYYDYSESKETYDHKVTTAKKYYRSSSPYLDNVSFVPKSGVTGTVSIDFSGESTSGDSFSGTVTIKVGSSSSSSSGDITYSATAGKPVTFEVGDFNSVCKDETSANLDYVTFTLPTSSKGVLYYEYDEDNEDYTHKVTTAKKYYRSSSPYVDRVTFVPESSSAGTISISYSGESINGDSFSGTIKITYKSATTKNPSVIYYTSENGEPVDFVKSDFTSACNDRDAGSLSSVKFSLPSSAYGTLYYGYTDAGKYDGTVSSATAYGTGTGANSIENVTFVPAAGYDGKVTVTYTGTDSKGDTYTGSIVITVEQMFSDMGSYGWAAESVYYLYDKGVTTGTSDTTYNPSGKIKRGDFILMLYRAFNLKAETDGNFSDVSEGDYYYEAIAVAKALGIAQGSGDLFRPEDSLTREDAMVLISRTLEEIGETVSSADESYLDSFDDGGRVSSYAREAVADLVKAGIIKGDDTGNLNPRNSLTRAEMAVILYRVLAL